MKKVWIGLSVACVLIGVLGTIEDVMSGTPFEEAAVLLFFFGLLAALFAWFAWLWRIRSPLKRTAEQIGAIADTAYRRCGYCSCWSMAVGGWKLGYLLACSWNGGSDCRHRHFYDGFPGGL